MVGPELLGIELKGVSFDDGIRCAGHALRG